MDEALVLARFSALSNATRLKIFRCLVTAAPGGMLAGDVSEAVGATPSRASFHLAAMLETGLLSSERTSRNITYKVDFSAVGELMQFMVRDCCQNNETVLSCCNSAKCC